VCQLHGGDIGVSSKEGEGSTFGFFFKVRRSSEDGRPLLQSRSNSENSQTSTHEQTTKPTRPSYSRANSNLTQIKERSNERPGAKTLTSHSGVDLDEVDSTLESLKNPPTEYVAEAHPEVSGNDRMKVTENIAKTIQPEQSVDESIEKRLLKLQRGETERQESIAAATSKSQRLQRSDEKQTLLLVEDNLINQKVLRRQLQSRGFEVFVANNGQEAIDAVAERGQVAFDDPNQRNFFDCILMDQEMPIKDGNAATQEIRALQQGGKAGYSHILGISANVRDEQTKDMREAGMDDVISKPFKVEDLVKRINSIVLENGGQGEDAQDHRRKVGPPTNTVEESNIPVRPTIESNERAKIKLGGNAQEDSTTRHGNQGRTTSWHQDSEIRNKANQDRRDASEEQDRREGRAGKASGREGEARGGERSRER
jgi:CheY-like chemotaxis protein